MAERHYTFRYPEYAVALYEALRDVPFYATMQRHVAADRDGRETMLRYLDYSIAEAETYGFIDEPPTHRYGVSVWSTPLPPDIQQQKYRQKAAFLEQHLGDDCLRVYTDIVNFMSSRSATVVDENDWYLSILGVLPPHQGSGLGAQILRCGLDRADALGINTWLETFTPRNRPFYRRLGYEEAASFNEPTTDAEYWIMTRRARQS